MLIKFRIALAAIIMALAAVLAVDDASACAGHVPSRGIDWGGYEFSGP
jgi:hypothetical protein